MDNAYLMLQNHIYGKDPFIDTIPASPLQLVTKKQPIFYLKCRNKKEYPKLSEKHNLSPFKITHLCEAIFSFIYFHQTTDQVRLNKEGRSTNPADFY